MGSGEDDDFVNNDVEAFPEDEDDAVDFGWQDDRKLSGRRKMTAHKKKAKPGSFETMGLSDGIMRSIRRKGYRLPTPIQRKAMPHIMQGLDVVGMARTGSGKTAAFVIPLIERLKAHAEGLGARAVILSPTRELALQTHKVVRELSKHTDLRIAALVGGDSMEAQFAELATHPDVLVVTPGRLVHHLEEVQGFGLKNVEYMVFDEADRLFEMGFADQLKVILSKASPHRQTLLFSATLPKALAEFARAGLKEPELVRLDAETRISPDLSLAFFTVRHGDKAAALLFLLHEVLPVDQPTVVFTSTRHHVEWLSILLGLEGIPAAFIHGHMDQSARKIQLAKFRAGKVPLLIVTDVAARGLDIPLIDNVINYDFPPNPKLFVHRTGRAARAGRTGSAYSLIARDEVPYLLDLHLFLSRPIEPAPVAGIAQAAASLDASSSIFGSFPQAALDDNIEHLRFLVESNADLQGAAHAADNAFKLYKRTRPAAAPESVRRAKIMPREGMHPVLAAALPSNALGGLEAQEGLADITARLKRYRPSATVFEAEVASARKGEGAGTAATPGIIAAASHERRVDVMKEKRLAHAKVIQKSSNNTFEEQEMICDASSMQAAARQSVVLPGPSGSRFREKGFFISHMPKDNVDKEVEKFYSIASADGLQGAVLDLTAEDASGQRTQRANYHWDKRSKNYIKLQPGEMVKAGKRVTASKKLKTSKEGTGLYAKWAKKNKVHVAPGQHRDDESSKAAALSNALTGRFKRGGRGWVNPLKQQHGADKFEKKKTQHNNNKRQATDELKNPDQVRKQRKLESKRKERHSIGSGQRGGNSKGRGRGGKRR